MDRPRPVAPGAASPNAPTRSNVPLRSGAKDAMREMARRKAAQAMTGYAAPTSSANYRKGDATAAGGSPS